MHFLPERLLQERLDGERLLVQRLGTSGWHAIARTEHELCRMMQLAIVPRAELLEEAAIRKAERLLERFFPVRMVFEQAEILQERRELLAFLLLHEADDHRVGHLVRMVFLVHERHALLQRAMREGFGLDGRFGHAQVVERVELPFAQRLPLRLLGDARTDIVRRALLHPEQRLFIRIVAIGKLELQLVEELMRCRALAVARVVHDAGRAVERRQAFAPARPAAGDLGDLRRVLGALLELVREDGNVVVLRGRDVDIDVMDERRARSRGILLEDLHGGLDVLHHVRRDIARRMDVDALRGLGRRVCVVDKSGCDAENDHEK